MLVNKILEEIMKRKILVVMFAGMCVLAGCQNQNGTSENEVIEETVVEEAVTDEAVDSVSDYQAFVGEYQDSVSQRAIAVITENDDMSSAHVEIFWANASNSANLWTMDVTFEGEKLVYTNGEKYIVNYDDNGDEEKLGESIEMQGYFDWDGATGNISWTGAEEEACQSCVFEKVN